MIPKIIHYCWLSDDPYPEQIKECIDSWKKAMPDYEFVKWDKERFEINSVQYVKDAFKAKKYAFCADYIRIYALYTMGGIYLDSDVLVYKSFDPFLYHKSFSSIEFHYCLLYTHSFKKREKMIGIEAAVLGAEAKCEWLKDVLDYYHKTKFSLSSKQIEKNIMPRVIARILNQKYGFHYLPIAQTLRDDFQIYPTEVFSANFVEDNPIKYSSHLAANSWGYQKNTWREKIRTFLEKYNLLDLTRKIRGIEKLK